MAVARAAQIYGVYRRPPTRFLPALGPRLMRVRHAGVRTIPHTLCPLTLPYAPASYPHRDIARGAASDFTGRSDRPHLDGKRACVRGTRTWWPR